MPHWARVTTLGAGYSFTAPASSLPALSLPALSLPALSLSAPSLRHPALKDLSHTIAGVLGDRTEGVAHNGGWLTAEGKNSHSGWELIQKIPAHTLRLGMAYRHSLAVLQCPRYPFMGVGVSS